MYKTRLTVLHLAALVAMGLLAVPSEASADAADDAKIAALQKQVDLAKQLSTMQTDLIASQKAVIDAQKASTDSSTALLTSQKSLIDAMFPQITGGKAGAVTFDATTNIGALAQPGAIEALNKIAADVCKPLIATLDNTAASTNVVVVNDSDLKLMAQARSMNYQLESLKSGYTSAAPKPTVTLGSTYALPPGLALYGAGAVLKEVASFTQLFRSDTTVYGATIAVDQEALNHALMACASIKAPAKPTTHIYSPKSLLVWLLNNPGSSNVLSLLTNLAEARLNSDAELLDLASKTDAASKTRLAKLTALNTSMDALVGSLFATSDKVPEPLIVGVLAGEGINLKLGTDGRLFKATLANAAASGLKQTSIWYSDRLYSWTTITLEYSAIDARGEVLAAGTVNTAIESKKIVLGH